MNAPASTVEEFAHALEQHAPLYEVQTSVPVIKQLCEYYEMVNEWNARLHLVAPCSPAEFATRHVLESLFALPFLAARAKVIDIGSGAGLPIIPCLIARADLHATLFEASPKKAVFLREALQRINARERAIVIAQRFEHRSSPRADFITCRALDRFTKMLPELFAWSPPGSTLLLFGGPAVRAQIENAALAYQAIHIPQSEQRFIFVVRKESKV